MKITAESLYNIHKTYDILTANHELKVAFMASFLATQLVPDDDIFSEKLYMAGLLHDIGKLFIPLSILNKKTSLSRTEFSLIKCHSLLGWNLLFNFNFDKDICDMVLYHHERLNGSGYPEGLKEPDIPAGAKILAIADVFEAMISPRLYKEAKPLEEVLLHLSNDELFDQGVVSVLVDVLQDINYNIEDIFKLAL